MWLTAFTACMLYGMVASTSQTLHNNSRTVRLGDYWCWLLVETAAHPADAAVRAYYAMVTLAASMR